MLDDKIVVNIQTLIAIAVPLLTLLGAGITKLFDYRNQLATIKLENRKTDLDDERVDIERMNSDASAAANLADVLSTVVQPLANRISMLEDEAIARQKMIIELSDTVYELKKTIRDKDEELDKLRKEYDVQVAISAEQEVRICEQNDKISAQELRIIELEMKIKEMKKAEECKED